MKACAATFLVCYPSPEEAKKAAASWQKVGYCAACKNYHVGRG